MPAKKIDGCWVAYSSTVCVPFKSEINALRYAVPRGLDVKCVPWGTDALGHETDDSEVDEAPDLNADRFPTATVDEGTD